MIVPSVFIMSACGESGHKHDWQWYFNETSHWRACSSCGNVWIEEEKHLPHWYDCDIGSHIGTCWHCGYVFDGDHTWIDRQHSQCTLCEFSLFNIEYSSDSEYGEYCIIGLNEFLPEGTNLEGYADLKIPSYLMIDGKRYAVGCIREGAFANCTWLKSVTIPSTVKYVSSDVFAYCESLTTVNWGENAKTIPSGAFRWCQSLKTINRTGNVENIGENAFECTNMNENLFNGQSCGRLKRIGASAFKQTKFTNLKVPSSVINIGTRAFCACEDLKTIEILNKNAELGDGLFAGCNIESITMPYTKLSNAVGLPESLKTVNIISAKNNIIPEYAFGSYSCIENITLSDGITTISRLAFDNCSKLKNIKIPASVTTIGGNAFRGTGLTDFEYGGTLNQWLGIDFANELSNPTAITNDIKIDGSVVTSVNISGVKTISSCALYNCKSITSVTISDDLTQIGEGVFEGCDNLAELTMPYVCSMEHIFGENIPSSFTTLTFTSATKLGEKVFKGCSNLTKLTLPSTLTTICDSNGLTTATQLYYSGTLNDWVKIDFKNNKANPTYYTKNLYINNEKVTGVASLQSNISKYAFINYGDITEVELSSTTTQVGTDAFSGCTNISKINYTGTIDQWVGINFESEKSNPTYFVGELYLNNEEVTKIEFSSATSVAPNSFINCAGITEVNLPGNITSIGAGAFKGTGLTKMNYSGTIDQWIQIYFGDQYANPIYKTHELYINNAEVKEIKIEQATSISQYAFVNLKYRRTSITITIGYNVKSIGVGAFANCFADINYTGTMSQWAQIAFADAKSNPCNYSSYLEINNKKLETITAEDLKDTTSISDFAFYYCSDLEKVTLHSGIKSIGESAFDKCNSLTKTDFKGTASQWAQIKFVNEKSNPLYYAKHLYINGEELFSIEFKDVEKISDFAFMNCISLLYVTFGDNVKEIGKCAFTSCFRLIKVVTSDSVTKIGKLAFKSCYNLTSLVVGKNVKDVDRWAFINCYNLFEVYNLSDLSFTKNSDSYIISYAKDVYKSLDAKSKLSKDAKGYVTFANGTDKILVGYEGSDRSLTLPQGITQIGKYVFYDMNWIESVTIPEGVTTIGERAFENCSGLQTFIFPTSITTIGGYVFYNCEKLNAIYFKGTAEEWEKIGWSVNYELYYYSNTKPTTSGNYWSYVNGAPKAWEPITEE